MKRIIGLICVAVLLVSIAAFAEPATLEELNVMTKEELVELAAGLLGIETEETEEDPATEAGEVETYVEAKKGDNNENAKKVQTRLIEMGYLTGSADGIYGNGTAAAVSSFQSQNGLPVTGTADVAMQELLFSADCPRAIVYEKLEYKADSRDPDVYEGRYVQFTGKVLQVIEDDGYVAFRIATRGNYDDVVFAMMKVPESYSRILEDDRVTVQGQYANLYSYETVRGDTMTIPFIMATNISLKG